MEVIVTIVPMACKNSWLQISESHFASGNSRKANPNTVFNINPMLRVFFLPSRGIMKSISNIIKCPE